MGNLREKACKAKGEEENNEEKTSSREEKMVEISKESGVKVTEAQWYHAKSTPLFTEMGIALLTAVFPMNVLLKSNLKGGAPKIKRPEGNASKPTTKLVALDPIKLHAIKDTVSNAFKEKYNAAVLGTAINNKLNSLRRLCKPEECHEVTNNA